MSSEPFPHVTNTAPLQILWDSLALSKSRVFYEDWKDNFVKQDLQKLNEFVTKHVSGRGPAEYIPDSIHEGTYNIILRFKFLAGGNDVALRIPQVGLDDGPLGMEKIANEVAWMEYLKANTSIPIVHVYSHGTDASSLLPVLNLPYIIMDWLSGMTVRDLLSSEDHKKLRPILYRQLASFHLDFCQLSFEEIGFVVKDGASQQWALRRPITFDMFNQATQTSNYSYEDWPSTVFKDARSYFDFVTKQQQTQLWQLGNINKMYEKREGDPADIPPYKPDEIARLRYEARYRFSQLCNDPKFCPPSEEFSRFHVFNADFDPRNMKADPDTGIISGVFDLEFTNSMPASFSFDPPLYLFGLPGPNMEMNLLPLWLDFNEPLINEFLDIMKQEEQKRGDKNTNRPPLSTLMHDSWTSKRVWFNFGLNHSDYLDATYWVMLHGCQSNGIEELPADVKVDLEKYASQAEQQVKAFESGFYTWRSEYWRKKNATGTT